MKISLKETEDNVLNLLKNTKVEGKPFMEVLEQRLDERHVKVVGQISQFIKGTKGKIIDFGAGNGGAAQILHDKYGLDVEAVDASDYRSGNITVPFLKFKDGKIPVPDNYYNTAVLIAVLHHDTNNERILQELTRIVKHRLIIQETSPIDHTKQEWERTFATDVLWNRFFHYADVPVPGSYESPQGWIQRFAKYGWKLVAREELGYDTATAKVFHNLLVFEK